MTSDQLEHLITMRLHLLELNQTLEVAEHDVSNQMAAALRVLGESLTFLSERIALREVDPTEVWEQTGEIVASLARARRAWFGRPDEREGDAIPSINRSRPVAQDHPLIPEYEHVPR